MYVIAITGGLGAGKTEALRFFEARGAVTIDLDEVARSFLTPESEVHEALVAAFGEDILDVDGTIVRSRLAEEAFRCDATATTLGAVVHPHVVEAVDARLQELALQARPPSVVAIEVPLLVETPALTDSVDLVISVEAPEETRIARAVARGMAEEDALARTSRQATDEQRRAIADVVLANAAAPDDLVSALATLWSERIAPMHGPSGDEEMT